MVVEGLLGLFSGAFGSFINKGLGIFEKHLDHKQELSLQKLQIEARRQETEHELAIAMEETYSDMRTKSYEHDMSAKSVSPWVNNILRLVRPLLTLFLIVLVGAIWFTVAENDTSLKIQIVDGVIYMSTAALAWWFGDRAPHNKRLPWQR